MGWYSCIHVTEYLRKVGNGLHGEPRKPKNGFMSACWPYCKVEQAGNWRPKAGYKQTKVESRSTQGPPRDNKLF